MLDTNWVQPPFNIMRAASAELVVSDLERAKAFYVDTLGFVLTEQTADRLYLRGYEECLHHSLTLRQGKTAIVDHLAFRVAAPNDLDALAQFYDKLGCPIRWSANAESGQTRILQVQDPLGFPHQFFADMAPAARLLQRFDLYRGAAVMRIDHFNLFVPHVPIAYDYYKSLGFRCSEYTVTAPPDEKLWASWLYRKPSVHDVALMNGAGPRLHHLGFWVSDMHSIIHLCDVLAASGQGHTIERGPGRHGLSNAFFLYLRDPDGHRIEFYTSDYYTGDPDFAPIRWDINDPQRGTFWGHAAPACWFEEASLVAGPDGAPMPIRPGQLNERPVIAI